MYLVCCNLSEYYRMPCSVYGQDRPAVTVTIFSTFYRFDISHSGYQPAPSCCFLFIQGQRSFFFPLTRVTACTSVFVTRQCETWHGVMNGYVDRVSVPYSDLNLIGCPCNRGFVPLLMYLPHRPSKTSRWHKGSRSWQCVLPRQFHTTAESISRKSQVWPWTRLRLDLFPFWMHHTQRRGGSKAIPHRGSSAYPSQVV